MEALDPLTGLPIRGIGVREYVKHVARHGELNLNERGEPIRFEGNRRARRKAAALGRKGVRVVVGPPVFYPVDPGALRVARGQPEVRQAS